MTVKSNNVEVIPVTIHHSDGEEVCEGHEVGDLVIGTESYEEALAASLASRGGTHARSSTFGYSRALEANWPTSMDGANSAIVPRNRLVD